MPNLKSANACLKRLFSKALAAKRAVIGSHISLVLLFVLFVINFYILFATKTYFLQKIQDVPISACAFVSHASEDLS